jgi:hypothetical protein
MKRVLTPSAAGWGLLTWTPGQTDIIKTIALVLIIDHTGLLLAGNNGDASAGERLFSAVWSGLGGIWPGITTFASRS